MNLGDAQNRAVGPAPFALDLAQMERMLAVVEAELRASFPLDFYRRCAFAAYGLLALCEDAGVPASLTGGRFGAFVMSPDRQRMAVQGFGSGPEPYPHLWVETTDHLVDLGPHLLPFGSTYAVVPMPAVVWDLAAPLPAALRYQPGETLPPDSRISADPEVAEQCDAFITNCRARAAAPNGPARLRTWIATNYGSLQEAVRRRDSWALGAKRFETIAQRQPMPF